MARRDDALVAALRDPASLQKVLPKQVIITEVLAEGGQGIVFRGAVDSRPAAVKVYFAGQVQQRVDREIAALNRLKCRSVAALLWSGTVDLKGTTLAVVATALVPGRPLSQWIVEGPLTHALVGAVAYDVTEAIEHLWAGRIVHRDLKPSNIVVTPEGRACVIDLGVAKHLDLSPLTVVGMTWGTFGYMSPEQLQGAKQLTCKSDLFGLGVVLLECALGEHPSHQDQLRLLASRFHESLPPRVGAWPFAELAQRLLQPQPVRRPQPAYVASMLTAYAPKT